MKKSRQQDKLCSNCGNVRTDEHPDAAFDQQEKMDTTCLHCGFTDFGFCKIPSKCFGVVTNCCKGNHNYDLKLKNYENIIEKVHICCEI